MTTKRALMALALSALACTSTHSDHGTETGNPPVIDFDHSGCKAQAFGLTQQRLNAPKQRASSSYDGLTCFVWERISEDEIQIELTNYETGCLADKGWQPRVELAADGTLELALQDDNCAQAACLSCLYDLTFHVQLDQIASRDREVSLDQRGCGEQPRDGKRALLPLASQATGAVCTYTSYAALRGAAQPGTVGAHAPCAPSAGRTCDESLSCVDPRTTPVVNFSDGPRCLASCQSDADCDELSRCESSVCILSAVGLASY